jgi:hypothetical protein
MAHLSYLSATVKVIDCVPDDSEGENPKDDEWNPQPHTDALLHDKKCDRGAAENKRTASQMLQGKASVLL